MTDIARTPLPPIADWTREIAAEVARAARHKLSLSNRLFYDGDHWQNGDGWIGPHAAVGEQGSETALSEIQKGFTSKNAIREVTDRHTGGVVGRQSAWGLIPRRALADDEAPTPAEQALIDEAEAALTTWWNTQHVPDAIANAARAMLLEQSGTLRLYIPSSMLVREIVIDADGNQVVNENGDPVTQLVIRAADLNAALAQIFLDAPTAAQGVVVRDNDTQREIGIYLQESTDGVLTVELCYLGDAFDASGERLSAVRVLSADGVSEILLPLGGRLPMHTERRDAIITDSVQQQQRALNLALSMLPRNVITGGFLERVLMNAQLPGKYVSDSTVSGGKRFQPDPLYFGPGTINAFTGIATEDPTTARQVLATPTMNYHEPVDVSSSISAADKHYAEILDETQQAHILMNDQATPSGKSRAEARADYANSLNKTAQRVESMGVWLLETTLAMAEYFSRAPGRYTSVLRATFTPRLDLGPVDASTQAQIAANVDAGLLSLETGMQMLGVEDVDAEIARVLAQPGANLDLRKRQAELFGLWIAAGLPDAVAAKLSGLSDEDIAMLVTAQRDIVPPAPLPGPALVPPSAAAA